jgi:hypothetical protein
VTGAQQRQGQIPDVQHHPGPPLQVARDEQHPKRWGVQHGTFWRANITAGRPSACATRAT